VERHRRYPPAARFRQEEGVVRVRFELDAAGQVRHVALESPSGFPALDAAALALLAGATLPAPPAGMDPARRSVSLPIRYRLE
jgi:protein TonB